jgi:hypothetical protein
VRHYEQAVQRAHEAQRALFDGDEPELLRALNGIER